MGIQQLKNEMGIEQQERAGDIRSLLGLQANTPRPKEEEEDETPRRTIRIGSESRRPNLMPTERETDTVQKRQERLKVRAKLHNRGLTRERDLHLIVVEEELLRCEFCGETKILEKATVMFQQRCMTAKQEGWWDKICDKLNRERNDGESDHEEARISRNLFDLFEPTARTEEAITTATTHGMVTTKKQSEPNRDTMVKSKAE